MAKAASKKPKTTANTVSKGIDLDSLDPETFAALARAVKDKEKEKDPWSAAEDLEAELDPDANEDEEDEEGADGVGLDGDGNHMEDDEDVIGPNQTRESRPHPRVVTPSTHMASSTPFTLPILQFSIV
jgi:hypothetical protein